MKKRIIAVIVMLLFTFSCAIGKIGYVSLCGDYEAAEGYNSYSMTISKIGATIYDRNDIKFNNDKSEYAAIIRPNEKCLSELSKLFDADEIKEITKELSSGYPVIRSIDEYKETDYIKITSRIVSSSKMHCRQMLSSECGGLEKYLDNVSGEKTVSFSVDARGKILEGGVCDIKSNNYSAIDGVHTTLDYAIQLSAEKAAKNMDSGAIVVLDAGTSQILACVSKPDDYMNRCIASYSVGSVFKLIVSACAIENNIDPLYNCEGSIKVGDTEYSCQKKKKHGQQHIKEALSNSCNCYFVNLALKLGAQKLRKTAEDFGFDAKYTLYDNWNIKSGNLPSETVLSSYGQLAMLGFGQGSLTDSPVHFAAAVAAIANGGFYNPPTLTESDISYEQIISKKTSQALRQYMRFVVSNGTGYAADYKNSSAGKTATAQTGQYIDGKEVLHTYFAGFYPYKSPKYSIVIMNENGKSGSGDCAPVFRSLVAMLDNM